MTNLQQAAFEYEQAIVALKQATDSRGLKIMLGPMARPIDPDNPLKSRRPSARDYGMYLRSFLDPMSSDSVFLDNEANFAHNCKLLAAAWEAAARYEELTK